MYKLFLTLRYLTRKAIVIFPILVVWLCVMMLIIVTSIMGGFVDRVRTANRELLGDIVVYSNAAAGWPYYEDFQKELAKIPGVEASTPVVYSYGLINLVDYRAQKPAQIIGIDPAGRAQVSRFRQSLFRQYASPRAAVEDLAATGLPATGQTLAERAGESAAAAEHAQALAYDTWDKADNTPPPPNSFNHCWWLLGLLPTALLAIVLCALTWRRGRFWRFVDLLVPLACLAAIAVPFTDPILHPPVDQRYADYYFDQLHQDVVRTERANRTFDFTYQPDPAHLDPHKLNPATLYRTPAELAAVLVPPEPTFNPPPEANARYLAAHATPPTQGCIIGVDLARDLGLYERDRRGNYLRPLSLDYPRAVLTIVPIAHGGSALQDQASSEDFTIVDDAYARVIDVDSTYVYAPLATVQKMALMSNPDDPSEPKRCSQIEIKVTGADDPHTLSRVRDKIRRALDQFAQLHPELRSLHVETWDEKQALYIGAVENEKTMITFILGLMSLVVIVVIFLIFYMIVRDKTRDIGILKALGATEEGVVAIFASYGLFIGLIGGALGVLTGVEFVFHTNEIHELIYQVTGITIWNRSVYLFDRIPDTVNWHEVLLYFCIALLAGFIGALRPAIKAGCQDPVKAVRYE